MERRGSRLGRRAFVGSMAGLGLLAGCGRLPGQARVPRLGLLGQSSAGSLSTRDGLFQGLHDLGYVDGQNIVIESRLAPELAAELVQLSVDVIVVDGGRAVLAARQATDTITIVIGFSAIDPVG
jgi:putative tryptophan/tyrosine transport system substrate-binding protein